MQNFGRPDLALAPLDLIPWHLEVAVVVMHWLYDIRGVSRLH